MTHIFTPIDLEADLASLNFSIARADLAFFDEELERFVEQATEAELPPSIFELAGCAFPDIIPVGLHEAPLWLVWLGKSTDSEIDDLARTPLTAVMQMSVDLMKCREMVAWNTGTHSLRVSARSLRHSLNASLDTEVLVLFATPDRVVSRPTWVSVELIDDLYDMSSVCGVAYLPLKAYTRAERTAARMRSVVLGNDPKVDDEGREILVLQPRQLPSDW